MSKTSSDLSVAKGDWDEKKAGGSPSDSPDWSGLSRVSMSEASSDQAPPESFAQEAAQDLSP